MSLGGSCRGRRGRAHDESLRLLLVPDGEFGTAMRHATSRARALTFLRTERYFPLAQNATRSFRICPREPHIDSERVVHAADRVESRANDGRRRTASCDYRSSSASLSVSLSSTKRRSHRDGRTTMANGRRSLVLSCNKEEENHRLWPVCIRVTRADSEGRGVNSCGRTSGAAL